MVYCTKCGNKNDENAQFCRVCGAPIHVSYTRYQRYEKHEKEENVGRDLCFGAHRRGYIWGIIFGGLLILWGVVAVIGAIYNIHIDFWPLILIIIGIIILANAINRYQRE